MPPSDPVRVPGGGSPTTRAARQPHTACSARRSPHRASARRVSPAARMTPARRAARRPARRSGGTYCDPLCRAAPEPADGRALARVVTVCEPVPPQEAERMLAGCRERLTAHVVREQGVGDPLLLLRGQVAMAM